MKKILLLSAAVSMMVACNNKNERANDDTRQSVIDSMNMVARQQQVMDSLSRASAAETPQAVLIENPSETNTVAPPPSKGPSKTPKKQPPVTKEDPKPTGEQPAGTPQKESETTAGTATAATEQPSTAGTETMTPEEKKKKGLNNAAKGAIIGLGTGAAAGAVINKNNRGKGAVVGGVVGAIGGAVGGAVIDKRNKKKEAEKDSTDNK